MSSRWVIPARSVFVEPRFCRALDALIGTGARVKARDLDPDLYGLLEAIHVEGIRWAATATDVGVLTSVDGAAEVAGSSPHGALLQMTTIEAAERLEISPHGIRAAVRAGRLPSVRLGGRHLFTPADLDAYAASHSRRTR